MDSGQKQGWRGAVSEGFLKVAAGGGSGVSVLGREKSLRQILEGGGPGRGQVQGMVDGARGGQGGQGLAHGRVRVGERRRPWGTRGSVHRVW